MNPQESLTLQRLIKENDVVDQTENIRKLKHSEDIKRDIIRINVLHEKEKELKINNKKEFDDLLRRECSFLYNNYTDIFNKLKNEEINVQLLLLFVQKLAAIENGESNQHNASYEIGQILKQIYIDSALKRTEKNEKEVIEKINKEPAINISWKQYKSMNSA